MKPGPQKDPSEVQILSFDYTDDLNPGETLVYTAGVSPAVSILQVGGMTMDQAIGSMLIGSPAISGSLVQQTLGGGMNNNNYAIKCLCSTSQGRVIAKACVIYCVPAYLQL